MKGVSKFISTILMLMITIALAGMAYMYTYTYIEGIMSARFPKKDWVCVLREELTLREISSNPNYTDIDLLSFEKIDNAILFKLNITKAPRYEGVCDLQIEDMKFIPKDPEIETGIKSIKIEEVCTADTVTILYRIENMNYIPEGSLQIYTHGKGHASIYIIEGISTELTCLVEYNNKTGIYRDTQTKEKCEIKSFICCERECEDFFGSKIISKCINWELEQKLVCGDEVYDLEEVGLI